MISLGSKERRIIQTQVQPELKDTRVEAHTVEFYGEEGKALGGIRLVIPSFQRGSLLGIAFKRARPECLKAVHVKFFTESVTKEKK